MELRWDKGPLEGEKGGTDDHRLRVWGYEKRQWGIAHFFLKHRVPETHRWDFSSKPISVNTTEEKKRLEALWAQANAPDNNEAKQGREALVAELYGATTTP